MMTTESMHEWREWKNHLLSEIHELRKENKEIGKTLTKIENEITGLKVKAGVIATAAGVLTGFFPGIFDVFRRH